MIDIDVLLFIPLSITRAVIIGFALYTSIPAQEVVVFADISFLSLYPLMIFFNVYEMKKLYWDVLAEKIVPVAVLDGAAPPKEGPLAYDNWYSR